MRESPSHTYLELVADEAIDEVEVAATLGEALARALEKQMTAIPRSA